MLYMFHTYVASVLYECYACLQWFLMVFASVSDAWFKCLICLFYILPLLHLDVLKVDRVLYMGCAWETEEDASVPHAAVRRRRHSGSMGPAWARVTQARSSNIRIARAHPWTRETEARKRAAAVGIRTVAVPFIYWI
jgi:hypothetical protein